MKIYCFNCESPVSDKAASCPKCGHPLSETHTPLVVVSGKPKWAIASIIISLLLAGGAWYAKSVSVVELQKVRSSVDRLQIRESIREFAVKEGHFPTTEHLDHGVEIADKLISSGKFSREVVCVVIGALIGNNDFLTYTVGQWETMIDLGMNVALARDNKDEQSPIVKPSTIEFVSSSPFIIYAMDTCEGYSDNLLILVVALFMDALNAGHQLNDLAVEIKSKFDNQELECYVSCLAVAKMMIVNDQEARDAKAYEDREKQLKLVTRTPVQFSGPTANRQSPTFTAPALPKVVSHQKFDTHQSDYLALKPRSIRYAMKHADRVVNQCRVSLASHAATESETVDCEAALYRASYFRSPLNFRMNIDATQHTPEGLEISGSIRIKNRYPDFDFMSIRDNDRANKANVNYGKTQYEHKQTHEAVDATRGRGHTIKSTKQALRSHRNWVNTTSIRQYNANQKLKLMYDKVESRKRRYETINLTVLLPNSQAQRFDIKRIEKVNKITVTAKVKSVGIHPRLNFESEESYPAYIDALTCRLVSLPKKFILSPSALPSAPNTPITASKK